MKSLIIDVRDPEDFAQAHIKGSINIPLGKSFSNWVGSVVIERTLVDVVVGKDSNQLLDAVKNLGLIGLDRVAEQLLWSEIQKDKYQLETLPLIEVGDLAERLKDKKKGIVLDVRTSSEWISGHIKGALHHELALLQKEVSEIPKDIPIYAICGSGYRSSVAASWLRKQGYQEVFSVRGGMSAWVRNGLEIV